MTYKTIIAHLDDEQRAQSLLKNAVALSRRLDAHLVGLVVVPPFVVIPGGEVYGGNVTLEEHRDAHRLVMKRLKERFDSATPGLDGLREWREVDAGFRSVTDMLIDQARTSDLVMISHSKERRESDAFAEEPDRLVIEAGCPVMIVPIDDRVRLPAKRVTVAWNGRRESTRAVLDALPLMKLADEVNILSINPDREFRGTSDIAGADLAAMLARHGVTCVASQSNVPGADVGPELLRLASSFGSDLLVMGCYGHSRLREFILGGATRDVLALTMIPLLMSH
jgi:nucleotide-binding universal stress UspA family protein